MLMHSTIFTSEIDIINFFFYISISFLFSPFIFFFFLSTNNSDLVDVHCFSLKHSIDARNILLDKNLAVQCFCTKNFLFLECVVVIIEAEKTVQTEVKMKKKINTKFVIQTVFIDVF